MTTYVAVTQPVGQQQLVSMQPAPVTFSTVNPQPRSGAWKGILWTGIIQVVLGSLTTILGIVTLTVFGPVFMYLDVGSPAWCGILFYVVAGILGTLSGCKKSSVVAIGYMVMSILACLAACCVIGFGAYMMAFVNSFCRPRGTFLTDLCDLKAAVNGVYGTLIILALAEFVVAIVGASMTCGPLCNGGSTTQTVIQYQAVPHVVAAPQPQGPVLYNIPTGQPQVAYPAQQVQYPQAQASPTGEQQCQDLIK
ncbi:uncharacterized protein LOC119730151 [Patiria miniata]|uniref:Membrane-spanning 4-domains subfamily A member 4A-like n=1 Tax=Patiria miniata TaxID=46514 RepID=A0A914A4S5_PATMI|nr:uncharacterized protein LOC119730151 [Patiria miniata]